MCSSDLRLRGLCRPESGASALGRIHALWTLEGLGGLDLETVTAALGDPVPRARGTALRLCEAFLKGNQREEAVQAIYSRAGFVPPEERLQLFLTLGEIGTPAADNILKVLLMNGSGNRLHFDAAISGLRGRELEFLESLVNDPYCATAKPEHAVLIARLARCVIHEGIPAQMDRLLGTAATRKPGDWQQLAILDGVLASFPPPGKSGARPVARAPVVTSVLMCCSPLRMLETLDYRGERRPTLACGLNPGPWRVSLFANAFEP